MGTMEEGGANVQSTEKWEVINLIVQLIFQLCAVHLSILSNYIFIILIHFWKHYIRCIPCEEFPDIVILLSTRITSITTYCGVIYRK